MWKKLIWVLGGRRGAPQGVAFGQVGSWVYHAPRIPQKIDKKIFESSKLFSSQFLVGWGWDSSDRMNCWKCRGWECTLKWQKKSKKWQNPIFATVKPCQWAIMLLNNLYIIFSIPRINTVKCQQVCLQGHGSALPPQTQQKWQKLLKMANIQHFDLCLK